MKKSIFFIFLFINSSFPVYAEKYKNSILPKIANPAWVYPSNRKFYKGYDKKKNRIENGSDWKFSTNRPTGKNRGGGAIYYYDYRSVKQRTR
ncbi:MAG: hypothetical protein CSA18_01585 [Deltaproteobacteria bacterium]|nr:MAG: hypothetical protein CSA18_01585 [Deltaproteobacteria bacterium]